jgi:hypothetical protein
MVVGIGFVALLTGAVAQRFLAPLYAQSGLYPVWRFKALTLGRSAPC